MLAGQKITDGSPINLGTGRRYKIREAAEKVFKVMRWRPKRIVFDTAKPIGVISRALDITRARKMLGWKPRYSLENGL